MHVEFTSLVGRPANPGAPTPLADLREVKTRAELLERHGFDRVIIATAPERHDIDRVTSLVLDGTTSISVAVSHRAGLSAPVEAANRFARLDQTSGGRLAICMLDASGAAVRGSGLEHADELARADEYIVLLKRLWANSAPFDHEGPHYSVQNGFVAEKPFCDGRIPLILGGASGTAISVAARHADIFALPAGSDDDIAWTMSRVTAAAQAVGRAAKVRFSLDITPVVAQTQTGAARRAQKLGIDPAGGLVGSPERVALTLLRLAHLGVSEFVVHGLRDVEDISMCGDEVAALVRRSLARTPARHERIATAPQGRHARHARSAF